MCGIAGILRVAGDEANALRAVEQMTAALAHRGPDGTGHWYDLHAGISLGHRRLAIIDLSAQGAQPMESACGRWVLAFNGEIYNFREIKRLLDARNGGHWKSSSDTEVLVEAIAAWGLEAALRRCDGMFALAVWDRRHSELQLARDRFGEKPLYVAWHGGRFAFASELRAMGVLDDAFRALDYEGLRWLMRMGYIPAPWTPFSGVYKVPHGTYLTVRPQDSPPSSVESFRAKCRRYWNGTLFAEESRKRGTLRDAEQAVKVLESALEASVARRMVADVPLGAFLSGGIDSSLVASLMAKLSATQVQTYTIGFDDASMDETDHAARVADALRTDHHVERFRTDDALALVSELHTIYDEPLADPSQLPTVLLCRTARRHVKVALSGDGGDELFFGYQRHFNALGMWRYLSRVPPHLRRMGGAVLERLGTRVPSRARRHWRRKAFLDSRDASVLHVAMSEHWSVPGEDLGYVDELHSSRLGAMANMRLFDQAMYLPGALMPKCDRASMAVGLELRMPFLEIDVLQLAWRMPDDFLFRASQGKWILRKLLARHLPRDITDRKKQGFAVPLARWLRNELRNWAESLVEEAQDTHSGCLDTAALRGLWQSHLRGQEDASDPLWTALSLLAWLRSCPTAARLICA